MAASKENLAFALLLSMLVALCAATLLIIHPGLEVEPELVRGVGRIGRNNQ